MDSVEYKSIYQKALTELATLMDRREQLDIERDDIDTRIGQVRQGIKALIPLCDENAYATHPELFQSELNALMPDTGLTDAVRKVLANIAPKSATAVGVRTGLRAIGYEIKSKNILPSLHTILKRLEEKGEVGSKDVEGRTWYRWNPPVYKPKAQPEWGKQIDWNKVVEEMKKKS